MERVAAVFRQGNASLWDCCSGSDHSPEKAADLSDLVNSFMETDHNMESHDMQILEDDNYNQYCCYCDPEIENKLQTLFQSQNKAKETIRAEAEQALQRARSCQGFKRQLMTHLRKNGFDAGLCKSKWEKFQTFPAGNHEYIDVHIDGNRYIVEILLAREFEIARPTSKYTSLLKIFPEIFVCNLEDMKQVVRLMCSAMKESMKRSDMHVPPWRRNGFMQAKWFGNFRRTTNEAQASKETFPEKNPLCFKMGYHCREDFGRKDGLRVGLLTAALGYNGLKL